MNWSPADITFISLSWSNEKTVNIYFSKDGDDEVIDEVMLFLWGHADGQKWNGEEDYRCFYHGIWRLLFFENRIKCCIFVRTGDSQEDVETL